MQIGSIAVYDLLKTNLGEKAAKSLVAFVEPEVETKFEQKKDILATKEDIANVRVEIRESKAELIKWMFIFFAGQIGIQTGLIIAVLKLFFS